MDPFKEIEVFRTSIASASQARRISGLLRARFPELRIDFDLEDCDNILRVRSLSSIPKEDIVKIVSHANIEIDILE